jgi:splicing factor 3A subunit 3
MERLKIELQRRGLLCGGTLQERAARLFLLKETPIQFLDPALLANGKQKKGGRRKRRSKKAPARQDTAGTSSTFHRDVSLKEYKIYRLANLLGEQLENTKLHIEKKQSRTPAEILAELEEEEGSDVEPEEEEEEEEVIIGKQNYPVGWDGKPIPYWLYKLHGLGIEYKCEICGNQSYWGRRAFERHFQEWRHSHGMRCLGIPNTRHFHEITKIADAIELWQKLKEDTVQAEFRPEEEMEFEDAEGNVYAKKTYELLQKQGLIE